LLLVDSVCSRFGRFGMATSVRMSCKMPASDPPGREVWNWQSLCLFVPLQWPERSVLPMSDQTSKPTRRDFIATGAIAAAAFTIVPRHVLGKGFTAPSDLVNVAVVGINGQGGVNCQAMMSQNIV